MSDDPGRCPPDRRPVDRVVFDLGETLVDETRNWGRWADHLCVPHLTLFAAMGAAIADRRPHIDAFQLFLPGFDLAIERVAKAAAGLGWEVGAADLYPDALPVLARLRTEGYRLAVMANQPLDASPLLASLPVDAWATSAGWGVAKPDPRFFARLVATVGAPADRIAYVGDRVDNDVLPARAAGMVAVHLRRGPWGVLQGDWPEAAQAARTLSDLDQLPAALASL